MKTKELIERVNTVQGITADVVGQRITFYEVGQEFPFYAMDKENDCFGQGFSKLDNLRDTNMGRLSYVIDALGEYFETPLAEREEEKRYYLRLVNPMFKGKKDIYLNQDFYAPEIYYIDSKAEADGMRTIFSESEIAKMNITGFEKVEVPE